MKQTPGPNAKKSLSNGTERIMENCREESSGPVGIYSSVLVTESPAVDRQPKIEASC